MEANTTTVDEIDDRSFNKTNTYTADVHVPRNYPRPVSELIPRVRKESEDDNSSDCDCDEWFSAVNLNKSSELFYSTSSLRFSNPNLSSTPLKYLKKKKYPTQSTPSMYYSMNVIEEHRESTSDNEHFTEAESELVLNHTSHNHDCNNVSCTDDDGLISPVSWNSNVDTDHNSEKSDYYEVMFSLLSTVDLSKIPYKSSRKTRKNPPNSQPNITNTETPQFVRMLSSPPFIQTTKTKIYGLCAAIFPNIMTFGAIAFYLFDIGSDLRLALFYLSENNLSYFLLTVFFVMLPPFCIAIYIMIGPHPYSEIQNRKRRLYKKAGGVLQALFLIRPIVTELKVWKLVMEESSESDTIQTDDDAELNIENITSMSNIQVNAIFRARKEAKLWGMVSSVLEDAPQLILQLAIFIQQSANEPEKLNSRLVAMLFSLVGITRLVTFYDIGLAPTNLRDISKVLLVLSYHLFVISSRVIAMSLVAAFHPITMGVWMAIHWLLMVALTKKFSIIGYFRHHWPDLLMATYHMIATTTRLSVFSTRTKMQVVQLFYIFVIENVVIFLWMLIGKPRNGIYAYLTYVGIAFMVFAAIFLFLCLHFEIFEWLPKSAPGAKSIRSLENHGYFESLGQRHNRDLIPHYIAFY